MLAGLRLLSLLLATAAATPAGLLILRSDGKLQFADAIEIHVNGKDKTLVLGAKPESPAPIKDLPDIKISSSLMLDAATGVFVEYGKSIPTRYLYPDGLPKGAPAAASEAWKLSKFTYKKAHSDKALSESPAASVVAYLAGGVDELASVCMDPAALKLIAGNPDSFKAQLELTAAAVAAFGAQPAMQPVERQVASAMRLRVERFDKGIDSAKSLDGGLQIARLSAAAYSSLPEHDALRKQLAEKRTWLDRRVAILRALAAGAQWDPFLLGFREFEKHQASFPDLAKQYQDAMLASLDQHWKAGKQRLTRGQMYKAYEEFRTASYRRPSDAAVQKDLSIAWTEYSRQYAVDTRSKRKSLSAGERDAMTQALHFAARYREQKKLDDAMKSVIEAERIDATALPVLLAKAEIQSARGELTSALATLDSFDLVAVEEERAPGAKLRNEILFQLTTGMEELRKKVEAAWSAGRYHESLALARQGLIANPKAPAFLYNAGLGSLATRDLESGSTLLKRFLDTPASLDSDAAQRARVHVLLAGLKPPAVPAEGDPNWFSGAKLPPGHSYCPISLAFQQKVDRIAASNKMNVRYVWEGARLKSIVPSFEKSEQATGEKPVVFTYAPAVPHAIAVDTGDAARKPVADPDELLLNSNVLLPNNPLADPLMIHRLGGKLSTLTVAGNRYFHPFVWQRPYVFSVEYDDRGRAVTARQVSEGDTPDQPKITLEFSWDNLRLTAIRGYHQVPGATAPTLVYERVQRYVQDKLTGEEIRAAGKNSTIKYVWNGNQLVSAECGKDMTLDGRSRDVFFAGAGKTQTN